MVNANLLMLSSLNNAIGVLQGLMGNCCGKKVPELRVIVFGLDGSGKSTLLRVLEASAFTLTSLNRIKCSNSIV